MMSLPQSQLNLISVAIEIANSNHLRKLNPSHSLEEIIQELCLDLQLPYKEGQYALQLNMVNSKVKNKYINECNRSEVQNGFILKLVYSPSEMATILIHNINAGGELYPLGEKAVTALETLQGLASDSSFAKEFYARDGLRIIFYLVTVTELPKEQLISCLIILDSMMGNKCAPKLPFPVTERVVRFVVNTVNPGPEIITTSLSILAQIVGQGDDDYVAENVGSQELMPHLSNQDNQTIQKNVLALINKMANSNTRKLHSSMVSRNMKETIAKNILKNDVPSNSYLGKELFEYQLLILSYKKRKLNTPVDVTGRDALQIRELNDINGKLKESSRSSIGYLQASELPPGKSLSMQDFLRPAKGTDYNRPMSATDHLLYDTSTVILRSDLHAVMLDSVNPVSRLTLNCMLFFARTSPEQYVRVMAAEEASWQPYPTTCERVVKLVVDAMSNTRNKKTSVRKYQPLLFHNPAFIEEVFCRMFLQLGRIRRDMKAWSNTDQEKVLWVLQRQLKEALSKQPKTLKDLTDKLQEYNYATISDIWAKERNNEENQKMNHSPAILELKESRKEEVVGLIRQQRINLLLKGNTFPKIHSRNKSKKRNTFVILSSNQKTFHYHDCDEDGRTIPDTSGKISLSDVTSMVTGKRCPHAMKEARMNNKFEYELAFSLLLDLEPSRSFDFVAPDQETFDFWTDGINVILCKDMRSKTMESELEMLLDMEVRLQLLDIRINDISHEAPPIPAAPDNYDFHSGL